MDQAERTAIYLQNLNDRLDASDPRDAAQYEELASIAPTITEEDLRDLALIP